MYFLMTSGKTLGLTSSNRNRRPGYSCHWNSPPPGGGRSLHVEVELQLWRIGKCMHFPMIHFAPKPRVDNHLDLSNKPLVKKRRLSRSLSAVAAQGNSTANITSGCCRATWPQWTNASNILAVREPAHQLRLILADFDVHWERHLKGIISRIGGEEIHEFPGNFFFAKTRLMLSSARGWRWKYRVKQWDTWAVGKCPAASFDHKCLFVHEVGAAIGGMGLPAPIFAISPSGPSKKDCGFVLRSSSLWRLAV